MMKKYIKYMASLLAVSFAMSACIDLEEMNVDPNNATTTNPSLLLTGVAYSAFNQTSSDACHAAKMLILTSGESKYQVYKWTRGDFDYYSNLRDVTKMSEEAGDSPVTQRPLCHARPRPLAGSSAITVRARSVSWVERKFRAVSMAGAG